MRHKCLRTQGHNDWTHKDDPCECECTYCSELTRLRNLKEVDQNEINQIWEDCVANWSQGPWKATQIRGFGHNNYIVTDSPKEAWFHIVAQVENVGSFDGMKRLAWCHDGVPRLLLTIEKLQEENKKLKEQLDDHYAVTQPKRP